MRTLKKTLCMVLVLAMMVGLCAIGASAVTLDDYSDKDAIKHTEAVAVLSKLNVLQGDDKGTFRPTDPLTRAESAAFFTRLCASSGIGTSTFTDMGAYAWAQPYVAYCQAAGIINGKGDGTFGPGESVTYIQWAKMCLGALGYDAAVEGLVGAAWEVNTLKLVNKLDLAANIANPDWNAPITRDDAAQMGFNVLTKIMVEYPDTLNIKVNTGDTNVEIEGAAYYDEIENNSYDFEYDAPDGDMQFCEQYFPNLKLNRKATNKDLFGMPQHTWYMGDNRKDHNLTFAKTIVSELAGSILATYTTNVATVTSKDLYTDAKVGKATDLTVIENGNENGTIPANRLLTDKVLAKYAGATIYLIDTNKEDESGYGQGDTLIVKYPVLAKVTKITEATAKKDRFATLSVYNYPTATPISVEYTTKNFARNDFILVYPYAKMADIATGDWAVNTNWQKAYPYGGILASELAETAPGTLSKVSTIAGKAYALTVGGISYSIGAEKLANLGPVAGLPVATNQDNYATGTGLTAYMANGYVLGVVADAVTFGDFVFVLASDESSTVLAKNFVAGYLNQDGTTAIVDIAATTAAHVPAAKDTKVVTWATMQPLATKYTFTKANATTYAKQVNLSGTFAIKPDTATVSDGFNYFVADAKTVFLVYNSTLNTYKVYTGIASLPTINGDLAKTMEAYALVPSYTGAHAAAVVVYPNGAEEKGATPNSIYLLNNGVSTSKESGLYGPVYNFSAIVDGELKTDIKSSDSSFTPYGLVTPTYNAANGYLIGTAVASYIKFDGEIGKALTAANGLLTVTDKYSVTRNFTLSETAKVYIYDLNDPTTVTAATVEDLNTVDAGATVTAVATRSSDTIATVYVVVPLD